jgi:hypothetical protein
MTMEYKYFLGSGRQEVLWRFNPDGACELSLNKPDNWIIGYPAHENAITVFDACNELTNREAKRLFPLATIL